MLKRSTAQSKLPSSKKRKVCVSKPSDGLTVALYKPPVYFDNAQSAIVRGDHNVMMSFFFFTEGGVPTVQWRLYVIQLFCILDRFTLNKIVPLFLDPSVIYALVVYQPLPDFDYANSFIFRHWQCNLCYTSKHSKGRSRAIRYTNLQTVQWRLYLIQLFSFLDRFTIRKLVPFFLDSSIKADHDMLCRDFLNSFGVELVPNDWNHDKKVGEYQAWITRMYEFSTFDKVNQVKLHYDARIESMQQKHAAEIQNKDRLIASLLNRIPKNF